LAQLRSTRRALACARRRGSAGARRQHLAKRCASEALGTALLLAVGLSVVIFDFGRESPLATLLPSAAGRRALTGFAFGSTGMGIALSPIGKVSGAHINPVVTFSFWAEGTMPFTAALAYVLSQLVGAVVGSLPLLAWGRMGASVSWAATYPGAAGTWAAFVGEMSTTFVLVSGLLVFVGHRPLRRFTPYIFPPMYAVMVWLEAAYSGTSTNPARSLGPDVVALDFHDYWLYWAAPLAGAVVALAARRLLPVLSSLEVSIARVAHFELGQLEQGPRF
jgi:aquaporin Z